MVRVRRYSFSKVCCGLLSDSSVSFESCSSASQATTCVTLGVVDGTGSDGDGTDVAGSDDGLYSVTTFPPNLVRMSV